jgi:hypothetical protein
MSRLCRFALLVAVLLLAAVCSSVRAGSASATPTLAPWQSDVCFTNACVWSPASGNYVAGGDGVSIESYLKGSGSWGGNVAKVIGNAGTIEAEAADVLPAFRMLPALQTIALGATAFSIGWKIGSTINTKWLHLEGVGLGTAEALGFVVSEHMYHTVSTANLSSYGVYEPDGLVLMFDLSDGQLRSDLVDPNNHGTTPCGAGTVCLSMWTIAHHQWSQFIHAGAVNSFGAHSEVIIPGSQIPSVLHIDQGLQPYTGQPSGMSSGWKVNGGCGDTTPACAYPGSQPNPVPSAPRLRCQLSGDVADCGASAPRICVGSDFSGLFGGAGSSGCGLGAGPQGTLNCLADPVDYFCPGTSGDGSSYSSGGGVAGSMPDCYGLTPGECEAIITTTRPGVTFTITVANTPDPKVADGRVIATMPAAGTKPVPGHAPITVNPPNSNPELCSWNVQNPHESTGTPGAVDVKAVAECNYQTTVSASLTLWKCDDEPMADLARLFNGDWGCIVPSSDATISGETRLAMPGVPVQFQVPPGGGTVIPPDNKWFIAYGMLDKAVPNWAFSNVVQIP